jgi:Domain of unknown function (DUF5658)
MRRRTPHAPRHAFSLDFCASVERNHHVDSPLASVQTRDVETHVYRLLILNLALQLFDGVATYQGLRLGFHEANPLLVAAFGLLGVGPALLLFKAKACGLLLLLHRATPARVGVTVLRALAAIYCVLSLGPWLGKFVSLAFAMV